jgi:hypothetical protein
MQAVQVLCLPYLVTSSSTETQLLCHNNKYTHNTTVAGPTLGTAKPSFVGNCDPVHIFVEETTFCFGVKTKCRRVNHIIDFLNIIHKPISERVIRSAVFYLKVCEVLPDYTVSHPRQV